MMTQKNFIRFLAKLPVYEMAMVKVWFCPILKQYGTWPSNGLKLIGTGIEFMQNR